MTRRFALFALIWLIVAGASWAMLWSAMPAASGPAFNTDFYKFLLSIRGFADTGELYAVSGETAAGLLHGNLNPPPFSLLVRPFADLDFAVGMALWQWLSLAGVMVSVPMLWRIAAPEDRIRGYLAALVLGLAIASGFPAVVVYAIGQVTFLLLPVLLAALIAILGGRAFTGGVLLGLLCLLKPLFGLLVVLLLLRGEVRAVAGAVTGGAIMLIGGTIAFGAGSWLDYMSVLGSIDWYDVSWNASLAGFLERLFGDGATARPTSAVLYAGVGIFMIALVWQIGRRIPDRQVGLRVTLAGGLPLLLLLSPLGWMYYWAWCLPAVALLMPVLRAAGRPGFVWWLLLPALGALRVTPLEPLPPDAGIWAGLIDWNFHVLQIAALFVLTLAAARIEHVSRTQPVTDQMVTTV